ncbi:MAG: hypothetical protein R6V13_13065 [Anaerolineae bacterium]
MIIHRLPDLKRYGILCIVASFILAALLLTGCGQAADHTPPPATVIRATEEISPTMAIQEEPSATATPEPPTPAPTESGPSEDYPYPPAAGTPERTATPAAYPTK